MRDSLATPTYWEMALDRQQDDLDYFAEYYPAPGKGKTEEEQSAHAYTDSLFDTTLAYYSAGKSMKEVVKMARSAVIDILPKYLADFPPGTEGGAVHTGYSNVHRWLAMLVLCRPTSEEVVIFYEGLDRYGVNPAMSDKPDYIWTIYRNILLGEDKPLPPTVHWPEAYAPLARAMDPELPDNVRPQYLREFLDGWYKEMAKEISAQTELGKNLGPNSAYVGYWCLEAAGAAVLLGIDDSTFADHPYYPKDWADWARGRG